jgi:thiamine-monophosphate kinase
MKEGTERTEIATLGRFGLMRRLTGGVAVKNESTLRGAGDNAAVLDYAGRQVVVATALMLEGIHFDLTYSPLKHTGYKAAVATFSGIYAMNGRPKQIAVSTGVSKRFCVEDMDELYGGLHIACDDYGVDLIGGDTSASVTGLTLGVTCLGEVEKGGAVYRDGARDTDLIYVSGDLGAAYMGLQLLEREKAVFAGEKDFSPDFGGREYLLERQLRPQARRDVIEMLYAAGLRPTSMTDVADGLSSGLLHLCRESNAGCLIYEDRIPIDYQTASMAEQFNINLVTAALNGGDDYELLFTIPLAAHEQMSAVKGVHLIGRITDASAGCNMTGRDGGEVRLVAQGWK